MKKNRISRVILFLAVLLFSSAVCGEAENEPFFSFDSFGIHGSEDKAGNTRFLTDGKYHLSPLSKKYGVDPDFVPDTSGLDELRISGSAEFSEQQFKNLADQLRECANGDPVYIIDLRCESHALINGLSVSWCNSHNDANRGMTLEEIRKDEEERLGSLTGGTISVYKGSHHKEKNRREVFVESFMTEEELVKGEGFKYLRLNAVDHEWPEPDVVDAFFQFTKTIDLDHVWLHFHCMAGRGRTGIFMSIIDMMKNPEVPLGDILVRQAMTGSSYLLDVNTKPTESYKEELKAARAELIQMMYQYIQENRAFGYEKPWSEWLEEMQEAEAA